MQSFAKFYAKFRRVILYVFSFLRNTAISLAKLSEKKYFLVTSHDGIEFIKITQKTQFAI